MDIEEQERQSENSHTLYLTIYNKLKDDIIRGVYPIGSVLPTEMDLTKEFYVSRTTVQKAMQLLLKEGYISRTAGRGTFVEKIPIAPQKHTIGLVLCNIAYSFGLDILTSVEREAAKYGYHVVFKNSMDSSQKETQAINDLAAFGAEGIIIQPVHKEYYNEALIQLHFNKFPIVLVDRFFSGFPIPSISTDNAAAAKAVTNYLFAHGHDRITFICSPQQNTSSVQDRIDGFLSAHLEANKPTHNSDVLHTILSPHLQNNEKMFQQDIETIKRHLLDSPDVTAIISSEFSITQMIVQAVQQLGKKIPDDYSLVMFDGYESIYPSIATHVEQDQAEIGRRAVEILLAQLTGKTVPIKTHIPVTIGEVNTFGRRER